MYDDYFAFAHELQQRGVPFATAVVVRSERPTSAGPGDRAIITADGVLHGWIGGSCAQPTVVRAALDAIRDGRCRLVRLSPDPGAEALPPGYEEVPMTCFSGGTLDVHIEPQAPQPRLLIVGDLPVARALAHLGKALSYHVLAVVEPGAEEAMAHADRVRTDVDAIAEWATPWTYVVVATHGHDDEGALARALTSEAPYVALVASRRRASAVAEGLRAEGLPSAAVDRLRSPAGLDIGARRGDEIALSILAEIVRERRNAVSQLMDTKSEVESETEPESAKEGEPEPAVDPVCGMTVTVSERTPAVEHEGATYYFCCGGCAAKFREAPAGFLADA